MVVNVDEAWSEDEAHRVENRFSRPRLYPADLDDRPIFYPNVAAERRPAGAVDDAGVLYEKRDGRLQNTRRRWLREEQQDNDTGKELGGHRLAK